MSADILNQAKWSIAAPDWFNSPRDLSMLWPALVSGRARIMDSGVTEAHHYLQVATVRATPRVNRPTESRVAILERLLLGDAPKVIAMDVGCSTSTITRAAGHTLHAMGLRSGRIPALLVLILHARRGKAQSVDLHVEHALDGDHDRHLVTSARFESSLERMLSASEMVVVSLLAEGKTGVEIARHRGTSVHTVANQIASVYRTLGVSGRMELLCHLVSRLERKPEAPARGAFAPSCGHSELTSNGRRD